MGKLFNKVKEIMLNEYADEYDEYEENDNSKDFEDTQYQNNQNIREMPRQRERDIEFEAPVSNRRSNQSQQRAPIQNLHQNFHNEESEVKMIIAKPEKYEDSQGICDQIKQDIPVIVNLEKVEYPVAQRIMDFLSGTSYALDGNVQRVASNIFLFTPEHVDISIDFKSEMKTKPMPSWANGR